jgi:histidine triad (HIT) family protein
MTIFSKIIAGEIPSYKIAENDKFFAFLDIFPLQKGHTLVVPKIEIDIIFDLPNDYLRDILVFAKPIALAIQQAYPCNRVNMITVGLEVPHAHIHLLPINETNDMNMANKKLLLTKDELKQVQENILQFL